MENWKWTALILCGFGLFKEFRPSESFFTEYVVDYKEVSLDDVVHVAFPVSTYSYLGTLIIVFLVTDFLRYRSVVIFEGIAYVITWSVLIWGFGLPAVLVVEFMYGVTCSTEVAYYTYIYAQVDKSHYKKITSFTYASTLTGRFLAGISAQLLISFNILDIHQLNYISLCSVSIALLLSLCLPKVQKSIYFNTQNSKSIKEKIQVAIPVLFNDFKSAFSDFGIIKWSLWFSVATAGNLHVLNYVQALWEIVREEDENFSESYNGGIDAVQCALSAIMALGIGWINIAWKKYGEFYLGMISVVEGLVLFFASKTSSMIVAYGAYIIFRITYQLTITIASSEISQKIREDSYGLIFGINTFVALLLQTLLTIIVNDGKIGLRLSEREQFLVLSIVYAFLGAIYLVYTIWKIVRSSLINSKNENINK